MGPIKRHAGAGAAGYVTELEPNSGVPPAESASEDGVGIGTSPGEAAVLAPVRASMLSVRRSTSDAGGEAKNEK